MLDSLLEALVTEMKVRHGVHTLVLYGSLARGDATAESDVDVAGFADVPEAYRDARPWRETVLDAFVYPSPMAVDHVTDELLKLAGGRVLLDERGLAAALIARADELERAPVAALPGHEVQTRRVWARKMVARAARGDIEAHYRLHWLLFQLLEDHYAIAAIRYPGPKRAFADLSARDPATLALFASALAPGAPLTTAVALVDHLERMPAAPFDVVGRVEDPVG